MAEFDHEARGSGWYAQYRRTHRGDGDGWHYEYTGNEQKPDEEG